MTFRQINGGLSRSFRDDTSSSAPCRIKVNNLTRHKQTSQITNDQTDFAILAMSN